MGDRAGAEAEGAQALRHAVGVARADLARM
jgi:hypothetical protein